MLGSPPFSLVLTPTTVFSELKEKASPGTFPVSHPSLGFQVLLLTPPSDIPPPGPGEHSLLGKRHTSVVHSCFQAAEGFQTDRDKMRPLPSTASQEKPQVRLEVQNGTWHKQFARNGGEGKAPLFPHHLPTTPLHVTPPAVSPSRKCFSTNKSSMYVATVCMSHRIWIFSL